MISIYHRGIKRFQQHALALAGLPVAVALALAVSAAPASAVSFKVKIACASDYYAHCSEHRPGSPEVRSCMRRNGSKLSQRCVSALINAGEVSGQEVAERKSRRQRRTASR